MTDLTEMVLVGRVTKPHGLRGHVFVDPETDFVEDRFAPGVRLWAQVGGEPCELIVTSSRLQGSRPVVAFEGQASRTDAEALVGVELRVPEAELTPLPEGRYYLHQLRGCTVETVRGDRVGIVSRVEIGAGDGCLVVLGSSGEVLVPLADDICVDVDVGAGRIRIAPPEGLLNLNAAAARRGGAHDT